LGVIDITNNAEYDSNRPIASHSLADLLPKSLTSSPAVSIRTTDKVSETASLLPHHLETFTDSLVVTKNDLPVGIIGSIEILERVLKNPTSTFFEETTAGQIMTTDKLVILNPNTTLSELLQRWVQTRRAFAFIPNQYHGYSVISARKLLEIGTSCKTDMTVSIISKKPMITFRKEDTVGNVIISMFENKTRKLILEGTSSFISDRINIQKITRELNCLRNIDKFLEMKVSIFKLDNVKKVPSELKINEASKIMYDMQSPYLMIDNQVITPWDIALSLSSNKLFDYN
jgi:CBS domain-containing protein